MRLVNAPISMRLFPKLVDWKAKPLEVVFVVELAIMLGNRKNRGWVRRGLLRKMFKKHRTDVDTYGGGGWSWKQI